MVRCPYCHRRFLIGESHSGITQRQQDILKAIPEIALDNNGIASTSAIASRVGWSVRTVRYELAYLEHEGQVMRNKYQAGWSLVERLVVMVA